MGAMLRKFWHSTVIYDGAYTQVVSREIVIWSDNGYTSELYLIRHLKKKNVVEVS